MIIKIKAHKEVKYCVNFFMSFQFLNTHKYLMLKNYNYFLFGWKNDDIIFANEYFENTLGTKNNPLIKINPF